MGEIPPSPPRVSGIFRTFLLHSVDDFRRNPHIVAPVLFLLLAVPLAIYKLYGGAGTELLHITIPQLVQAASPLVVLSLGAGLVIAGGQIDLSNTAIAAIAGLLYVAFLQDTAVGPGGALIVAFGFGLLAGALNGWLVAYVGAPSLVVTWSTGLTFTVAGVIIASQLGGLTSGIALKDPILGAFALGANGFTYFVTGTLFAVFVVLSSNLSREAMAVGADSQAATYLGIIPRTVRFKTFLTSGFLGALAGVMYVYSIGNARTTELQQNSLSIVAICVLAGTLLSGGYFSAMSILFATMLWSLLELVVPKISLPFATPGLESDLNRIVFGMVLLVAVVAFARQLRGRLRPVLTMPKLEE